MEAAGHPLLVAGLALLMSTVPLAGVPATSGSSTPAEPALEATEPAVVSEPLPRGSVERTGDITQTDTTPVTVDGDPSDWQGTPTRLGGTTVLDAGELVYQGFLFDDHGADDGKDAQRMATLGPAYEEEHRLERLEALAQAADEQFGAPDPTGGVLVSPAHYGNAEVPSDLEGHADLLELRVTARQDTAYLMARTAAMTDPGALALLVLADTDPTAEELATVPFGSGIETRQAEQAFLVTTDGVWTADLATGQVSQLSTANVAADASGYTNALEAAIPLEQIAAETPEGQVQLDLAAGTGLHAGGGQLADVSTGEASANVVDVAFREEAKVSNWMDRGQALELLEGSMEHFETASVDEMRSGIGYDVQPTPGYHERVFSSSENISRESDKEGLFQHYGLYLPSDWQPASEDPLTFWLHWRGGTAHQAAAWTPRVFDQLGEEREPSNVVVSPRGRGTSTWYAGAGHLDVLQVYEDVHDFLAVDEDRRYLSGYSMGGYGSYLFGLLYPDRFAGAFPISGAMTIGLWAGVDDQGRDTTGANGGDGNLENTWRLVENARNLPYVIHHGTDDELVPVTGVQRMAAKFAELGYQYRFYRFLGYEHFSQAIVDQWAEGADYLDDQTRTENPARVVYKRVPALENAIETLNQRDADIDLNTDGAYWVSNVEVRDSDLTDPNVHGLVEAESSAIPDRHATTPESGAASTGHSTPYVMDGLDWTPVPCETDVLCPLLDPVENRLDVDLTNVGHVNVSADGAGLDTKNTEAVIGLDSDGPATLRVEGDWECPHDDHQLALLGPGELTVTEDVVIVEALAQASLHAEICQDGA